MDRFKRFFISDYYLKILKREAAFKSIFFILFLVLLMTIKPSFVVYKTALPFANDLENKIIKLIRNIFPSELTIQIKNGVASTNVTEPYYITVKKEALEDFSYLLGEENEETVSKIRLLVIDTKANAEDFERYQSFALLTENSIVYYDEGQIKIYPLRDIESMTINSDLFETKIKEVNQGNKIGNIVKIIIIILPIFIYFGLFIYILINYLYLCFLSYLMSRINQLPYRYGEMFTFIVAVSMIPTLMFFILTLLPYINAISDYQILLDVFILTVIYLLLKKIKNPEPIGSEEKLQQENRSYESESKSDEVPKATVINAI